MDIKQREQLIMSHERQYDEAQDCHPAAELFSNPTAGNCTLEPVSKSCRNELETGAIIPELCLRRATMSLGKTARQAAPRDASLRRTARTSLQNLQQQSC